MLDVRCPGQTGPLAPQGTEVAQDVDRALQSDVLERGEDGRGDGERRSILESFAQGARGQYGSHDGKAREALASTSAVVT